MMAVGESGARQPAEDGGSSVATEDESSLFADLLDRRDIRVEFQPLVDLRSGEVVALEALARGPESTKFASPAELFAEARRSGRVAELDWVCRAAAFEAFLDAKLPPALSLFVNTEPEGIAADCPADLANLVAKAESVLRVFVEVNDAALGSDPAGVLAAVDRARDMGWGLAIDDVGRNRVPVAMLPIVQADLVKLDLGLLGAASPEDYAATITSVLRHVETTGASLLVERIENEADARWARALGAVYGQGLHFGAPGPLAEDYRPPPVPVPLVKVVPHDLSIGSPFALFAGRRHRRMEKQLVDQLAQLIAHSPRSSEAWPIFLAGTGRDGDLSAGVSTNRDGSPRKALLFAAFGAGMPDQAGPGVRGVRVRQEDPLADERFLVVLSDQAPVALLARCAPDGMFDVVVTQDQELVHTVAHHLIRRVPGPGASNLALPAPTRPPRGGEHSEPGRPASPKRRGRRIIRRAIRRIW